MARFRHTFPVSGEYIILPVNLLPPMMVGDLRSGIIHLRIASTDYELTVGDDNIAYLSMRNIRDVRKLNCYLHNRQRRTKSK